MRWLCGCAHQLPLIGSPVIASVSRGAGPLAEARTTPCSRTKATASAAVTHLLISPKVRQQRPRATHECSYQKSSASWSPATMATFRFAVIRFIACPRLSPSSVMKTCKPRLRTDSGRRDNASAQVNASSSASSRVQLHAKIL